MELIFRNPSTVIEKWHYKQFSESVDPTFKEYKMQIIIESFSTNSK